MTEFIKQARFFFDSEVHAWLFNKLSDSCPVIQNCDFAYDVTDQPFYCSAVSGENCLDVKIFVRSEIGAFIESPDVGLRLYTDGRESEVLANSGRLGGNAGDVLAMFIKAAVYLAMYIESKELTAEYSNMNLDEEGIIVRLDGEELAFERVSGKDRPDMACTTLFGGIQMMRPYQNEIMDSWMDEMLPLEEKIALAEDGDEDMMEALAMSYLNGDFNIDPDAEQAVYWFTKLAELGNTNAQFNLALHCAKGFGMDRSFEKAIYWFEKAAEGGDTDALPMIEKLKKAVAAEKPAAEGDAQAQADLAATYIFLGGSLDQAGPENDYALALEFAEKAAAQDNGDGVWALALCYEHGRGVEADKAKAVELYRKGADLGHAPSQHSLACYYFRGDFLEEDYEKAFDLCLKSANQGYGLAMADIGRCYQFGNGVEYNMATAIEWYEKSLEVIYDPELERKVAVFKMIEENGGFGGDDFDDDDDDELYDPELSNLPDGYMEALEEFMEGEE